MVVAIGADKLKWRGPFILLFLPLTMVGEYILFLSDSHTRLMSPEGYIVAIVAKVR